MLLDAKAIAMHMMLALLIPAAIAYPQAEGTEASAAVPEEGSFEYNGTSLEKRGCSHNNSGTHCGGQQWRYQDGEAQAALDDLLSQCSNGNLPGGAKRVTSKTIGSGVIAYACNGGCRSKYMPCQDAEWSINRVKNHCRLDTPYAGWDSQETRGTWYGIGFSSEKPCGYEYSGRGATY